MHHGIKTIEITTGARPVADASTAVIGLIATSTDADAAYFPLDKPVLVTNIYEAIGKAGVAGTLKKVLQAIADQVSPTLVVVRVGTHATIGNQNGLVVGTVDVNGNKTGMQALLGAKSLLGEKPTIIGAPGHDTQTVAVALAALAAKLDGMAYAHAVADTVATAVTYRANFSEQELMLIWDDFSDFAGSAVARALGTRAWIDQYIGWHASLSNNAAKGVTGISRPIHFDMTGENTEAVTLNNADVTCLIQQKGFRYWGNRTCSSEPLFAFESVVRSAQFVRATIAEGLTWAIDKPITAQLIKDILGTINAKGRAIVASGRLMGFEAWYDPTKNSQTDLAGGKVVIDYKYNPCAPLESLTLNQRITSEYYGTLAAQIAA